MNVIDPTTFPPKLAEFLLLRGTSLLSLDWTRGPNRQARETLPKADDAALFGKSELDNTGMASATRALLYLWNGCKEEAIRLAKSAPPREQALIEAFCTRQTNDAPTTKTLLRKAGEHPIYKDLAAHALRLIGHRSDPLIVRFKQMLEMASAWEPFLFVDLYEQARGGKLDGPAEEAVRQILCVEFELLLRYCFTEAVGENAVARAARPAPGDPQVDRDRMRRLAQMHRPKRLVKEKPKTTAAVKKEEPATEIRSAPGIRVACPKCRNLLSLPATARGGIERCGRCQAAFQVPGESGGSGGARGASAPKKTFSLRCPKCSTTLALPESARGAVEQCGKCGSKFLVPGKQTAGAAR